MNEHDVVEITEDYSVVEETENGPRAIDLKKGMRGTIISPLVEDTVYLVEFQQFQPKDDGCIWLETHLLRKV